MNLSLRTCFSGALLVLPMLIGLYSASHASKHETPSKKPSAYAQNAKVLEFVQTMHKKHGFDPVKLTKEFAQVKTIESVLRAISRPPEQTKTWPQYRRILLSKSRIIGAVDFSSKHRLILKRAEMDYGVPKEVILAILGVETKYGTNQGRHKVFHALTTLAFGFPRRAEFFRKELEEFLLLTREQGFDIQVVTGSYAGAMGYGQFISSSYRHYAIDYDGDNIKDLFNNPADAIGSIANYLRKNGWQRNMPVAVLAQKQEDAQLSIVNQDKKPKYTLAELEAKGFIPMVKNIGDRNAMVLSFEFSEHEEYWLAFRNFSVIMSYNPRYFYAMTVYQLSQEIAKIIE